jgi:hypothetical protein
MYVFYCFSMARILTQLQLGVSAIGDTDIDFGYFGPVSCFSDGLFHHVLSLFSRRNTTCGPLRASKQSQGITYINSTNPSSEILGESAAALAATSVIFAEKDKVYSEKLLAHAINLYTRATTHQGSYMMSTHPNLKTLKEWYPSSIYTDELGWAALWLYVATKDEKYRTSADDEIQKSSSRSGEVSDPIVKGRAVWCGCMRRIYAQQIYALKNCAAMNREYV